MAAATREKIEPDSPENRRYLLASELIRRWRAISKKDGAKLTNEELADRAGIDAGTVSQVAQGWRVSEDTWVLIGDALDWGGFLDYVMRGDLGAVERSLHVDARIRIYALETLRHIAENDESQTSSLHSAG